MYTITNKNKGKDKKGRSYKFCVLYSKCTIE